MSISLYVVRHAIAVERSTERPDAQRALTAEGLARFAKEARGLARLGVELDLIAHSPWLRAAQTGELLRPLLAAEGEIRVETGLARAPAKELLSALPAGRVAVVGHEPWLSELIAWLLSGDPGDGAAFELKKGAVAHLAGEPLPGGMTMRSLLPPKVLRRLALRP
jgi:phosphohistidine phosphatase